jgi:DNA ligase (NAD+)
LHNEDEVLRKDIRVGDTVRIARAGDVIPEVVERIKTPGKKRSSKFSMPGKCPSCGSKIYREGANYFCSAGLSCIAQLKGSIEHYASREAMNIDGLGEKTVEQLVKRSMVSDIADLYALEKEDLLKLEGFAEKSAKNLHKSIQSTKNPQLDRFIYALGIRHVGQHVARVIANEYREFNKLKNAENEELQNIREIGPEIAESIVNFFKEKENMNVLKKLKNAGVEIKKMPKKQKNKLLEGKTFVFTGTLENYTRSEAEKIVEDLSARATSSVSSETDFVVVGEDPGSKLEDARVLNIKILTEKEFEELVK